MNILIVESRYHPDVANALVNGATAALEKGGAQFERMAVPGVLEIPAAIAIALRSRTAFDGYVALGCVTGALAEAFHAETLRGLMTLATAGVALGSGIVLAGDEGVAHDIATTQDIGGDSARACLALITFGERLGYMP
jgi:6,7-dimethyl-8-ribityllumazine synthase